MKILINTLPSKTKKSNKKFMSMEIEKKFRDTDEIEIIETNFDLKSIDSYLKDRVDILFLLGCENDESDLIKISDLRKKHNNISFVLEVKKPSTSFLLKCFELKIEDVISDAKSNIIEKKIREKIKQHESFLLNKPHEKKIISVLSSKGGDGSSFIATNFSYALSLDKRKKIVLVDMTFPIGNCEMYLTETDAKFNISDFIDSMDRIDNVLLDSMVQKIKVNLHFISGNADFKKIANIQNDEIITFVELLKNLYDYVVLDFGSGFDPTTLNIISESDDILLITSDNILSIRNAAKKLSVLESFNISIDKLSLIKNNIYNNSQITKKIISEGLNHDIVAEISHEPEVLFESLSLKKSVFELKNKSLISKNLLTFTQSFLGSLEKNMSPSLWNDIFKINIFDK